MKNVLILGILLISLCYSEESSKEISRVGVQINAGGGGRYYYNDGGPVIWIGPGIYYGIWFDDEYDYDDWYYYHRYRHHRYRYRNRHYHRPPRGHHGWHRGGRHRH